MTAGDNKTDSRVETHRRYIFSRLYADIFVAKIEIFDGRGSCRYILHVGSVKIRQCYR